MYIKLMLKVFKSDIVEFFLRDGEQMIQLIIDKRLDLIKIIYSETDAFLKIHNMLDLAAFKGLIELVIYLSEIGASCSTEAMDNAAESGYLEVIQFLHFNRSEGCSTGAMNQAAQFGQLETIIWMHLNRTEGCTTNAMDQAAANGHLEVLK